MYASVQIKKVDLWVWFASWIYTTTFKASEKNRIYEFCQRIISTHNFWSSLRCHKSFLSLQGTVCLRFAMSFRGPAYSHTWLDCVLAYFRSGNEYIDHRYSELTTPKSISCSGVLRMQIFKNTPGGSPGLSKVPYF